MPADEIERSDADSGTYCYVARREMETSSIRLQKHNPYLDYPKLDDVSVVMLWFM